MNVSHFFCGSITTSSCGLANLPPSNTTRLKEIFAVKFVVVNGCGLFTTKLNVVPCFVSSACRSFVPPITQRLDWPTILPWASRRKQTARADSTLSAKLFVIANVTMAFCPIAFGGVTVTANCADKLTTKATCKQNKSENFFTFAYLLFNPFFRIMYQDF